MMGSDFSVEMESIVHMFRTDLIVSCNIILQSTNLVTCLLGVVVHLHFLQLFLAVFHGFDPFLWFASVQMLCSVPTVNQDLCKKHYEPMK